MNYFVNVNTRSPTPPCVHPLLLSLALMFKESETSPNLSSVSEDNPKVLSSIYYASPKDLPPLDIHLPGQNGAVPFTDVHGSLLTSVASCGECMAPIPSAAPILEYVAPEPQDNSTEVGHSIVTIPSSGKKQRRAASGGVRSESHILSHRCTEK